MKEIEILARGVLVCDGALLVCHNKRTDNYFLPGGHVEWGESAKEALSREIAEEMGLKSSVGRFLAASEHSFVHKGKQTCEINLYFLLSIRGLRRDRPAPSKEAKLEFLWLPLLRLGRSKLNPSHLRKDLIRWLNELAVENWGSSYP